MNIGRFIIRDLTRKLNLDTVALRLLHLLALTPGQGGRRPMMMRGQIGAPPGGGELSHVCVSQQGTGARIWGTGCMMDLNASRIKGHD